ncbi:MAG: hypothetical protein FWE19_08310 [Oscillospiraceae bacterium]|nr:hypothetical protein [Oscillospiraceae bacterium]
MKKILAVAVAVAMLASMSISAAATPSEADGTGAISFGLLPDGTIPPALGGHDPLPPGQDPFPGPDVLWPDFPPVPDPDWTGPGPNPGIQPNTPTLMDSIDLDFGPRQLPTGTLGPRGWASHPVTAEAGATPDIYRLAPAPGTIFNPWLFAEGDPDPYEDSSTLGLLWNQGAYPVDPTDPTLGYNLVSDRNVAINARMGFFHMVPSSGVPAPTLANRTLQGFDLTLRTAYVPGYLSVRQPRTAAGAPGTHTPGDPIPGGEVSDFTRAGLTVIDSNPLVHPNWAAAVNVDGWGAAVDMVHFQAGFLGIEWAGLLEGIWDGTNVERGDAQADILFTEVVVVV